MRYAICNETFEGWDHERICRFIAGLGYTGLELAPFTLADRITAVDAETRTRLRAQAAEYGIQLLGLHWLLARTTGLGLTSPDASVRATTAAYLVELARACRDLGGDILVFGSPAQRKIPEGHSREQTVDLAVDTFQRARTAIEDTGVRLCLEPLAPTESDFIQTADEACEILDRLASPAFVLHLDVKAMSSEKASIPDLIRRHIGRLGHFHANDANLRGPGFGDVDFKPILGTLKKVGYTGWVSVEVFDYKPDPETIACESIRYLRECQP